MDEARNNLSASTFRIPTSAFRLRACPRRKSNPDLRFRKPSFYPLNYGDASKGTSNIQRSTSNVQLQKREHVPAQDANAPKRGRGPVGKPNSELSTEMSNV